MSDAPEQQDAPVNVPTDAQGVPLPIYQPANAQPVPVAAQPSAPAAPAATPAPAPAQGSFADKLGAALQTFSSHPATPAVLQQPGGWSKMILAAAADALAPTPAPPQPSNAQRVVNGIENFFSPLAAFKGSPIAGAGVVAAHDQQQRAAQEQQAREQQLAMSKEQREKLQFGMQIALSNAQQLHSQFLLHKAQTDELNENAADGQKAVQTLQNQPQPGVVIGKDVTSDEIQRKIQNGSFNPSTMTAYATGKQQVGTDENGNPQYRALYTLVELPREVRIADPAEAKSLIPDLSDETLKRISESSPLILPGEIYNGRFQARETQQAIAATAQKAAEEAAIASGERSEKLEAQKFAFAGNTMLANDMSTLAKQHPNWSHPELVIGALQLLQTHPPVDANGQPKYPHLLQDALSALGEKNLDSIQTAAETARKDRAEEANKAGELNLKKAENNFVNPSGSSGLSGDAYLQTLPQPQRDLLASIAEGRNTKAAIQNRKGELTPLGLAVMQGYPDFDVQKAAKYGDTLKEYQSTKNGTAGGSLNAGATALKHLATLKQINDAHPMDVRIHGTKANLAYNNLLDTVADELVTFYNEPKTNEAIESKKSTLGSLANRDSAIVEQAKAMAAKLQSFQQSWDNASPRASFRPPMPYIDNDARTALQTLAPEFVQANPQFAPMRVFNSQAWAAANPGKDVNAAIAYAKQQGFQVK